MRLTVYLLGGLTLIVALEVTSAAALALEPPPGKPPVRNYSMAEYGGDLVNWAVRQAADQRIVVAGGEGLVIFDGANWQAIPTRHHNRIRAMEIDADGRIWIGSPNEIGYYEAGVDGGLVYHSLIEHLAEDQRRYRKFKRPFPAPYRAVSGGSRIGLPVLRASLRGVPVA